MYNDLLFYKILTNEFVQLTAPNAPPPRCSHQVGSTRHVGMGKNTKHIILFVKSSELKCKMTAMVVGKKPNLPKIYIAIDGKRFEQVTSLCISWELNN